jgi:hypothetical protein
MVPILVAAIGIVKGSSNDMKMPGTSNTFITNVSVIETQYQQITGQPLKDATLKRLQEAVNLAKAGQFEPSRHIFEEIASSIPVPAVYNNLGALYAQKGDAGAARGAYQQAVAKDPDFAPARNGLSSLSRPAGTGRGETEPNNDLPHANAVSLDTPVSAEIADTSDTDFFSFTTTRLRDIYRISLKNTSTTLQPGITLYDQQKNQIAYDSRGTSGADLDYDFPLAGDTTYYVQVWQRQNTSGTYSLTVKPQRRSDRFEPNDDILAAKAIALNKTIDANIMDPSDTDYYQIRPGSAGSLTVSLKNTSTTLQPGITLYDQQKNQIAYDSRGTSGADLDLAFNAAANNIYYIQVWQRDSTSGAYSLTVK